MISKCRLGKAPSQPGSVANGAPSRNVEATVLGQVTSVVGQKSVDYRAARASDLLDYFFRRLRCVSLMIVVSWGRCGDEGTLAETLPCSMLRHIGQLQRPGSFKVPMTMMSFRTREEYGGATKERACLWDRNGNRLAYMMVVALLLAYPPVQLKEKPNSSPSSLTFTLQTTLFFCKSLTATMQFSLLSIAALASIAVAGGINCNGSALCKSSGVAGNVSGKRHTSKMKEFPPCN